MSTPEKYDYKLRSKEESSLLVSTYVVIDSRSMKQYQITATDSYAEISTLPNKKRLGRVIRSSFIPYVKVEYSVSLQNRGMGEINLRLQIFGIHTLGTMTTNGWHLNYGTNIATTYDADRIPTVKIIESC